MASAEVMNPASLPAGKVEEYQAPISVIPAPDASGEPSRGGVPSSFYDNVAPEVYLGPRGVQRTLINKQGLKLNAYFWPAENSKCVLLFVCTSVTNAPPSRSSMKAEVVSAACCACVCV